MLSSKDFVDTTTLNKTSKVASSRCPENKIPHKIAIHKVMTSLTSKEQK